MKTDRLLWCAAVAVAVAGYALVVQPGELRVRAAELHARALYDEANVDDAKIRQASHLRVIQRRIEADVRTLSGQRSEGAITASALHMLSEEGRRFHVELVSVVPDPAVSPKSPDHLPTVPWTIGVRGEFRDVIRFISDIPRHDALVDVHDVDLTARPSAKSTSPALDVTIHALVYRVPALAFEEIPHASATP